MGMSYRLMFGYTVLAIVAIAFLSLAIAAIKLLSQDTPSSEPTPTTDRASYVIKKGDALSGISAKTGLTVERLEELNPSLDPLGLVPGTRIKLKPTRPPKPGEKEKGEPKKRVYTVKPGDGLLTIQDRTGVPVDRIRRLNPGIGRDPLQPGQRVKLRRGPP
ncbi:MAG: LysM peptidoglycan-binding domain-containing protein [Thermoleophilaceae bacterium]